MEDTQSNEPVFVVDREAAIRASQGKAVITMASKFSSFALTDEVDKDTSLRNVKAAFGRVCRLALRRLELRVQEQARSGLGYPSQGKKKWRCQ